MSAAKSSPLAVEFDPPEGWAAVPLMELCSLVRGVSYKKGEETSEPKPGYIPLLRANNINSTVILENIRYVPPARVSYAQKLRKGDVVIAMSSGSKSVVGKAATLTGAWNGTFGAFCGVLRPISSLDWRYFGLFFQTREYRGRISELAAGVNINNLKREYFEEMQFPLAPLDEQVRISDKVDQLLARVNVARERLARVPAILKRFRQAVLSAACSGRLTADWRSTHLQPSTSELLTKELAEQGKSVKLKQMAAVSPTRIAEDFDLPEIDETWTWASLGQLAGVEPNSITDGPFGSNLKTAHYTIAGPRVIRLQNIGECKFIDERAHISLEHFQKLAKHEIRSEDVVIACLGDPVPRACLIPKFVGPAIVKADCIRFKPNPKLTNSRYVCYVLNDEATRIGMAEAVHGVGRARLNLQQIKSIPIPLPPPDEQHEIVRRVEALFKLSDAIEKRVGAATDRAQKLTQAILAKAFRGELVPTEAELAHREGRPYEPASVLLARIQTTRQAPSEKPKQRSPRRRPPATRRS